jgi:hypothetical protein
VLLCKHLRPLKPNLAPLPKTDWELHTPLILGVFCFAFGSVSCVAPPVALLSFLQIDALDVGLPFDDVRGEQFVARSAHTLKYLTCAVISIFRVPVPVPFVCRPMVGHKKMCGSSLHAPPQAERGERVFNAFAEGDGGASEGDAESVCWALWMGRRRREWC